VITLSAARAAGWTDSAIRHAVISGQWCRLQRGCYVPAEVLGEADAGSQYLMAAIAAAHNCPRSVVSHGSAGTWYGLPLVGRVRHGCVTAPRGTPLRRLGHVHLHRAALLPGEAITRDGLGWTTPARTVIDLARERGADAGIAAADAALRMGIVTPAQLAAALRRCAGWPGVRAARAIVPLADGSAESALESISRLRLTHCALPLPVPQVEIGDAFGRFVARVDFFWPQAGVVGESDGAVKYDAGAEAVLSERRRQRALEDMGLLVVRWEWADLFHFDEVIARIRAAMRRGTQPESARRWTVLSSMHSAPSLTA
jgi:hypothetical protein